MLKVLEPHRQAYAYCAYCPKVCRFACPVSEVTKSETTSTWGKMSEAHLVAQEQRPLEEHGAKALYACTGCMRCRTYCNHENEVGFALFSARQVAVDKKLAPAGALSTLQSFSIHGNPFGKDLAPFVAEHRADAPVRYAFFPGCSSLVKRSELVDNARTVADALGAPLGVSKVANKCCGYPLYAAGDERAFVEHAQKFAAQLESYPEFVVMDPGCAYTLKVVYPRFDVKVPSEVKTVYEVLAERLDHGPPRPKLAMKVSYHDACHLGRGLGQYEQPRALLRAAVEELVEAREPKEHAGCSGGGGLLPRTMPDVAVGAAKSEAERHADKEATIVTACPTSRRMFDRAGRKASDLFEVLARWVNQESSKGEGT